MVERFQSWVWIRIHRRSIDWNRHTLKFKLMEELLREFGVKAGSWILALFTAIIFFVIRIYEPEQPPSRRKIIYLVSASLGTALLVPGLIVYWFGVDNPFLASFATASVVLSFESVTKIIRDKVIDKLKSKE
jgi:ABC-type amino acid transport system permease subunit